MLVIYSHVYLFLLNDVFKVVDGTIIALTTVSPAELCPSFPQGGQCCLPVGPGNCGAGGLRAGAKAGCRDFPRRRPLWLAGRLCCCTQTPQPTNFCNCKFPFTYKDLDFGSFHHRHFQKAVVSSDNAALVSSDTLAESAYAGDRDYLVLWASPRRRASESLGGLLSLG